MANFTWPINPSSSGPIEFLIDGTPTNVSEDTGTPANSVPLPIKVLDPSSGLPVDFATEAKQDDQITEAQAANVLLTSIDGKDFATETTLSALNVKIIKADTDNVSVVSSVLPAGAATEAKQDSIISDLGDIKTNTSNAVLELQTLSAVDFATEAKQDSIIAELQSANTSLGNIEAIDFATETTLSALNTKVTKADTDNVSVVSSVLPTGAATETTLAAVSGQLPATLGQTTMSASLPVVLSSDYVPPASPVPAALTVKQAAITVGTSPVRMTTDGNAPSATRRLLNVMVDPSSEARFWYGGASVNNTGSDRGIPLFPGQNLLPWINDPNDYYVISDQAGQTVFIVEVE